VTSRASTVGDVMSNTLAHKIRTSAKLSLSAAAALANVAPNTWKLFESNADAVTPQKRAACEAALAQMTTRS
jgi:hypothetical protein